MKKRKRMGDIFELKFAQKAIKNNLLVSKPLTEGLTYDFVVDYFSELSRIQVKSTSIDNNGYIIQTSYGRPRKAYTAEEIDYFAICIVPLDLWYLIPVEDLKGRKQIKILPENKNCEFSEYKENWKLIKPIRKYLTLLYAKRKPTGGIYPVKYGYMVRFGRNISKFFKSEEEAKAFLEDLRQKAEEADDNLNEGE